MHDYNLHKSIYQNGEIQGPWSQVQVLKRENCENELNLKKY